jgi:tetratricopeptide (TPR) repeat protein
MRPDFDHNRSLYGWCIYDLEIKRDDEQIAQNEGTFLRAANAILELVEPGQYSPYARTVLRVVDYYRKRPSYPATQVLEWCDKLLPEQLSNVPGRGPDGKGKMVEYASDREKWYSCRCKALFDVGRFEECIQCCEEAVAAFSSFHHDNDVWFNWRIALAKAEQGDKETAIAELQSLFVRKKDWFIYQRLAQYHFELGRVDEALEHALDAALAPGDLEYKWELFLLMGNILKAQSNLEVAQKHVLLAAKVRQELDWKMPAELSQAVQEMDLDMGTEVSVEDLHQEIRGYWQSQKVADMAEGRGKIKNMLTHGKAGFIRGDDGEDYYFKTSWFQGPRHLLEPGQRVAFHIEKNPDPSKRDMAKFVNPLE